MSVCMMFSKIHNDREGVKDMYKRMCMTAISGALYTPSLESLAAGSRGVMFGVQ